jgi:hypothetical protein
VNVLPQLCSRHINFLLLEHVSKLLVLVAGSVAVTVARQEERGSHKTENANMEPSYFCLLEPELESAGPGLIGDFVGGESPNGETWPGAVHWDGEK